MGATGTSGTRQDSAIGDLCGGDSGGATGRALLREGRRQAGCGGPRGDTPERGTPKRRRTELMREEASDDVTNGARVPELVAGTATRSKRKRTHRTASDAKRRREAAAAAFDGTESDEDEPAPAGPVPFSAPEVEEPDNPMDVG